jgi:hypothetical protein
MSKYAFLLFAGLSAALPCPPAAAQSVQSIDDCGKARDPARCRAMQQARAECQDKHGRDRHLCISARLPPPDCRNAADPVRCGERLKARKPIRNL